MDELARSHSARKNKKLGEAGVNGAKPGLLGLGPYDVAGKTAQSYTSALHEQHPASAGRQVENRLHTLS